MKLSIITPTLHERREFFDDISSHLIPQLTDDVEWLVLGDQRGMSLGKKMNLLYNMVQGEYVAVMNDDDMIPDNYIELMLKGCNSGKDVIVGKVASGHINNPHSITIEEYLLVPEVFYYHDYLNVLPAKTELVLKHTVWDEDPQYNDCGQDMIFVRKIMATKPTVYRVPDVFYYHAVAKECR